MVSDKLMRRGADLAVVKDENVSLPFFQEAAGRSSLVRQQQICCDHKRKKSKEISMQSILQESIRVLHRPLLLGLPVTDT